MTTLDVLNSSYETTERILREKSLNANVDVENVPEMEELSELF